MSTLSENIKDYRNNLNYSQEEVAQYLNVNREEISYYENGNRAIPLKKLLKLSDLFGVSLQSFQEEDKSKHKSFVALSFRKDKFCSDDFEEISQFVKIVKNYQKLKRLTQK